MRAVSVLFIGLLLAGCGADPSGVADYDLAAPVREPIGFPTAPYQGPDTDAVTLLGDLARWQRGLAGAAYTAKVYSRGAAGGKKPAGLPWAGGGEWESRTTWEVAYTRPGTYKFKAIESLQTGVAGLRIAFDAKGASLRPPGLGGLIARKRDLLHADLADCRGWSIAALTPGATATRLTAAASARIVGETRLDGVVLDLVEVPRTPSFDPEVVREVLGLERGSHALRLHQAFAGDGRKVYEQLLLGLR